MARVVTWIIRVFGWALRARLAVLAFLPLIIGILIVFSPIRTEPMVRLSGLAMQLIGIASVCIGILQTRRYFGLPRLFVIFVKWIRSFPRLQPMTIVGYVNETQPAQSESGRGYVLSSAGENPTIERRVQVLEDNLRRTLSMLDHCENEMDKRMATLSSDLKKQEDTIRSHVSALDTKFQLGQTNGLYVSAIGAFWILVGVALSTASGEIIRLLS